MVKFGCWILIIISLFVSNNFADKDRIEHPKHFPELMKPAVNIESSNDTSSNESNESDSFEGLPPPAVPLSDEE